MHMISAQEVAKHNSRESCWVIIKDHVYDVTDFLDDHPGGSSVVLRWGGKDATEEFEPIHPPNTLEEGLKPEQHLGPVDPATIQKPEIKHDQSKMVEDKPSLAQCVELDDFERAAEILLRPKAWAYYKSASDDEHTANYNRKAYSLISFRPKVLRDVSSVDITTSILGHKVTMPVYIAPAAMGRLAHPDGEFALSRTADKFGLLYTISANASCSFEDVASEPRNNNTPLFYQLYVNRDRASTEETLKRAVQTGYKAIVVTVDAATNSRRLRDERMKMKLDPQLASQFGPTTSATAGESIGNSLATNRDSSLSWKDLSWIKRVTGLPLIVKGIQRAEDAASCAAHGVEGITLSNHGGRQLNHAQTPIETLLEIRKKCPEVLNRCEIYVDGGIRSATDVLKAVALGAKAVGLGRPFMYSLAFGQEGSDAVAQLMMEELQVNMRLLGCTSLSEVTPRMVNSRRLEARLADDDFQAKL